MNVNILVWGMIFLLAGNINIISRPAVQKLAKDNSGAGCTL